MNDVACMQVTHPRRYVLGKIDSLFPRQGLVHVMDQVFQSPSADEFCHQMEFFVFAEHAYEPENVVMMQTP